MRINRLTTYFLIILFYTTLSSNVIASNKTSLRGVQTEWQSYKAVRHCEEPFMATWQSSIARIMPNQIATRIVEARNNANSLNSQKAVDEGQFKEELGATNTSSAAYTKYVSNGVLSSNNANSSNSQKAVDEGQFKEKLGATNTSSAAYTKYLSNGVLSSNNANSSNSPSIYVNSDYLTLDQTKSIINFEGKVILWFNDMVLKTDTIEVIYKQLANGREIDKIIIPNKLFAIRIVEQDILIADCAEYLMKSNKLILTGNVKLQHEDNVINTQKLIYHTKLRK